MKMNMTYVFELYDEKKLNERIFKVMYYDSLGGKSKLNRMLLSSVNGGCSIEH
ncbi:hypothetical protein QFZ72_004376 [Bacillus sp. V2I10]|nr:hypothetical protein [Bacillus sp. V2I10]